MNVTNLLTKEYVKWTLGQRGKKQTQTNPNKAKFKKAEMNLMSYITKDYEKMLNWALYENETNSNPKQTQNKPNSNPISRAKKRREKPACSRLILRFLMVEISLQ
jgi:hypothetical protein